MEIEETLKNSEYCEMNNNDLEEALDMYYELIRENKLIPRGNQLILDSIEFKRDSNFFN